MGLVRTVIAASVLLGLLLGGTTPTVTIPPEDNSMHSSAEMAVTDRQLFSNAAKTSVGDETPQPTVNVQASMHGPEMGERNRNTTVIEYRVSISSPDSVSNLYLIPDKRLTVADSSGMMKVGSWYKAEDGTGTLTLRVEANEAKPQFRWAISTPPLVAYRWKADEEYHTTYTLDEDANATLDATDNLDITSSQQVAMISRGDHKVRQFTVDGTRFRIVYDAAQTPDSFNISRLQQELTRSEKAFDVNATGDRITVFALPPSDTSPGYAWGTGLNESTRTVKASTAYFVGSKGGVWTHEYVHAKQSFKTGARMEWFVEGSARYYAILLQYQTVHPLDRNNPRMEAEMMFNKANRTPILTQPNTWENGTAYDKGSVAILVLDNKLRNKTDGRHTMVDVFRWMNQHDGVVTYSDFRRKLIRLGGESLGTWLDKHVAGNDPYATDQYELPVKKPVLEHDDPRDRKEHGPKTGHARRQRATPHTNETATNNTSEST